MKNTNLFSILILSLFIMCMIACEKTTLLNEQTTQTTLQSRGDCDECPNSNQCCCAISLHPSTSMATILVCGSTTIPITTCTKAASGGCPAFNGISYTLNLDGMTPRLPFCALVSGPFWIQNVSGGQVRILITCQNGETDPDIIDITLEDNETRFFTNNGGCEIGPC